MNGDLLVTLPTSSPVSPGEIKYGKKKKQIWIQLEFNIGTAELMNSLPGGGEGSPGATSMHRPSEFLTGSSFSMSNLMSVYGKKNWMEGEE